MDRVYCPSPPQQKSPTNPHKLDMAMSSNAQGIKQATWEDLIDYKTNNYSSYYHIGHHKQGKGQKIVISVAK